MIQIQVPLCGSRRLGRPLASVLCLVMAGPAALGCSSDSGDEASASDGGAPPDGTGGSTPGAGGAVNGSGGASGGGGAPSADSLLGRFTVDLQEPTASQPDGFASFLGKVFDGPTPGQIVWEEKARQGDCWLSEPRVPFCETPCGGSAVCVEDDVCQPYPTAISVGTITLSGVHTTDGRTEFSMDPVASTYQPTGGIRLPFEPFAAGDDVTLTAAGGELSPFSIATSGIAPLDLTTTDIRVQSGMPIVLEWDSAGAATASSIYVKIDISHHGGAKGLIECESSDDGSLEVSSALVTELLDLGFAGFPTIVVTRRAVGSTQVSLGTIELATSSKVERSVEIEGLVSCVPMADPSLEECPAGQSCGTDLRCQ